MDDLVIGVGDDLAARWVRDYFDSTPAVAQALRAANAVAVVFAPAERMRTGGSEFFGQVEAALRASEAAVPADKRAVFIAVVHGSDARASGAFDISGGRRTGPCPPLASARGLFFGYILLGEGGALFTDDRGDTRGGYPSADYVLGRIRAL
jgi:hypothetical protein